MYVDPRFCFSLNENYSYPSSSRIKVEYDSAFSFFASRSVIDSGKNLLYCDFLRISLALLYFQARWTLRDFENIPRTWRYFTNPYIISKYYVTCVKTDWHYYAGVCDLSLLRISKIWKTCKKFNWPFLLYCWAQPLRSDTTSDLLFRLIFLLLVIAFYFLFSTLRAANLGRSSARIASNMRSSFNSRGTSAKFERIKVNNLK